MTLLEAAVIIFGVFAGYWVVSKLFFRPPPVKDAGVSAAPPREANTQYWHEVLGVPPAATAEEIRDAYKHLVSKYHPDKVDSLGQELKDLAEHKTREITLAYRDGMRARGLDP
jgi:DnaJ like chaperone protein